MREYPIHEGAVVRVLGASMDHSEARHRPEESTDLIGVVITEEREDEWLVAFDYRNANDGGSRYAKYDTSKLQVVGAIYRDVDLPY